MKNQQTVASFDAHPAITSPRVLELFAYWNQIRGDRLAPRWADVDPGAIRGLLPYLIVGEVLSDPFDVRFRIVGSAIIENFGYDFTWKNLRSMNYLTRSDSWIEFYRGIVEAALPSCGQYQLDSRIYRGLCVDTCSLPLSGDGQTIDRLVELEDWAMAGGYWAARVDRDSWRFIVLEPPSR